MVVILSHLVLFKGVALCNVSIPETFHTSPSTVRWRLVGIFLLLHKLWCALLSPARSLLSPSPLPCCPSTTMCLSACACPPACPRPRSPPSHSCLVHAPPTSSVASMCAFLFWRLCVTYTHSALLQSVWRIVVCGAEHLTQASLCI